jgi:glyoxylase-like metal-dependent hydrolase (beta-lactamase superfamily II)
MATELTDGVWWCDLRSVNVYLVEDDGSVALIDVGTPFSRRRLVRALDEVGYVPGDIDHVLITHYDFDHIGGFGRLTLDADVYAGAPDAPLVAGDRTPRRLSRKGLFQRATEPLLTAPDGPVHAVEDGDSVGSFIVYHTPGHTPGHVCYVSEKLSVAFLGDLVRESDGRLEPSPWALSDDTDQVRASIQRLAEELPDVDVAAIGHGVPFRKGGSERLHELADRLEDAENTTNRGERKSAE